MYSFLAIVKIYFKYNAGLSMLIKPTLRSQFVCIIPKKLQNAIFVSNFLDYDANLEW